VKFFTEKVKNLFINTSLSETSPLSKRTLSVCQTLSMPGSKQLLVVSGVAQWGSARRRQHQLFCLGWQRLSLGGHRSGLGSQRLLHAARSIAKALAASHWPPGKSKGNKTPSKTRCRVKHMFAWMAQWAARPCVASVSPALKCASDSWTWPIWQAVLHPPQDSCD